MDGLKTTAAREQRKLETRPSFFHPVSLVRYVGIVDGVTLLVLFGFAMPLKYWADLPVAVTIVGTTHGAVFAAYLLTILYAQIRVQWPFGWTALAVAAGCIPFGSFVLDRVLKKRQHKFPVKPFPAIWLVYLAVLFTFLDLFTQLPVMSTFAVSLGATAMMAGFVVGMYSFTNTIGNILAGVLTDRLGAYAVFTAGLLATSLTLLLYQAVWSPEQLLAVRFLHGLLGGLIVPAAFTYIANVTRTERQGSQSAVTGSFVGIAAIVGPAYSGIMAARVGVPFVFTTVAAAGFALFLAVILFVRSRRVAIFRERRQAKRLEPNRGMVLAFAGAFFLMVSQGALAYLLPLHVQELGYDSRTSGMMMSIFGVIAVLLFVLPTKRIFDRVSPFVCYVIGLGLMGLSQILIGQSAGSLPLGAVMVLYGIGFSFLFPAINTMLAHSTSPDNRGKAYGLFYAFFSIGVVVGSSGLGLIPASLPTLFAIMGGVLLGCVAVSLATARPGAKPAEKNQPVG